MHQPRYQFILACLAVLSLVGSTILRADEVGDANSDQLAIRAVADEYMQSIRKGDVETLRKLWTSEGNYIDASGQVFRAQDLFRQDGATTAPESDSEVEVARESALRFITPDVAIEDGVGELGATKDGNVLTSRYTAVWVKRDGRWLLDGLRESVSRAPSAQDHLRPLEWLIGEWTGAADDTVMLVSSRWSEGGNYIVREFIVRADDREVLSGTQRIGWDPHAAKIKSWTFDSHGGSGEGYWRRDGERWVVDSEEVMPSGEMATASVVITPDGGGRFVWDVKSATVNGQSLPSTRVEFKRAAEEE